MKIKMKFKKETKRTAVYINEEEGIAVSQVYVQKATLPSPLPLEITLTIDECFSKSKS